MVQIHGHGTTWYHNHMVSHSTTTALTFNVWDCALTAVTSWCSHLLWCSHSVSNTYDSCRDSTQLSQLRPQMSYILICAMSVTLQQPVSKAVTPMVVARAAVIGCCNAIRDWLIEQGLTSHQTHCRSYRGRFLQVIWPNQQCQSTEETSWILIHISICTMPTVVVSSTSRCIYCTVYILHATAINIANNLATTAWLL